MKLVAATDYNRLLEGKLVRLRPIKLSDANARYVSWMNDPMVTRYLESRFQKHTLAGIKSYVADVLRNKTAYLFWAILACDSGLHIGNIKIGPINRHHRFADVGILIGEKQYWGKGLATEAVRLASDFAFRSRQIHRLTAGAYEINPGSTRAFEKAGYHRESIEDRKWYCEGRYINGVTLSMINPYEESCHA